MNGLRSAINWLASKRPIHSLRACTILAAAAFSIALVFLAHVPQAQATGKPMNLTAYCNAKHNPSGRGLPWRAKYYPGPGQWWCEQATETGPVSRGGGRKIIDPAQACLFMFDTLTIHTHTDLDPAIERNMHCGVHSGTVPPEAEMRRPAVLVVCNQTRSGGLSFGYALKYAARQSDSGWHAVGYWEVDQGDCKRITLPQSGDTMGYRGRVLIFGANRQRFFSGEATPICARWGRGFTRRDADNSETCPDKTYSMRQTSHITVRGGENRFAFTD